MTFLTSIHPQGLLSFAPESDPIELTALNVLIGPNGSGKSNLIAAIELLHALPNSLSSVIREGGGIREWLWKGEKQVESAKLNAVFADRFSFQTTLAARGQHFELAEEEIEHYRAPGAQPIYRNVKSVAAIQVHDGQDENGFPRLNLRPIEKSLLAADESILSQRRDPEHYPLLTWIGNELRRFQFFQDWQFGRLANPRRPQPADLPADVLLPDFRNLGLIINGLEHENQIAEFNARLSQFLPRFERTTTRVIGGTIQLFLHERGLSSPIPATRLSDGTLRFVAILATMLSPKPPPLVCIEEPELGLHPDAIAILAEVMVEAKERMQLIVTTHSDALISALTDHVESVLVCEYHQGTTVQRLEAAKLQSWLEEYRLGDIWRIGALGGNP